MSNPIDQQIKRLSEAVELFKQTFGRVPTVAFDADGVIYDFETAYIAHHNRMHADLPDFAGPFEHYDVGYGQTPEVAEAFQQSMRTLDWSEIVVYPEALAVLPVLVEAGLDLSIATAHRVDNIYSPAAKVFQFHEDFEGYFDDRIQVGIDKTRIVADFLVDDKDNINGKLVPQWQHLMFTQLYNRDLPGIHVVWETMFEVLASAIEAKIIGRTMPVAPASTAPVALPAEPAPVTDLADLADLAGLDEAPESPELAFDADDEALTDVLTEDAPQVLPDWATDEEDAPLVPATPVTWDDLLSGGETK